MKDNLSSGDADGGESRAVVDGNGDGEIEPLRLRVHVRQGRDARRTLDPYPPSPSMGGGFGSVTNVPEEPPLALALLTYADLPSRQMERIALRSPPPPPRATRKGL